jgi:hypothetical protein
MLPPPQKGRPRGGYFTCFIVVCIKSMFIKIDIIERLGIFAINEILADLMTRPKYFNCRGFL